MAADEEAKVTQKAASAATEHQADDLVRALDASSAPLSEALIQMGAKLPVSRKQRAA